MNIVERTITIKSGFKSTPVKININFPEKQQAGDFKCNFFIDWPDKPQLGAMYGVDSVQSLILSMNMIAFYLYGSSYHKEKKLFWEQIGDGYGFPLSNGFRSLAEGADAFL
jgi:hypothetical protein